MAKTAGEGKWRLISFPRALKQCTGWSMMVPSEPELGVGPEIGKVRHMDGVIPQCSNSVGAVKTLQEVCISSHMCLATDDKTQFCYCTELWVSFPVCITAPLLQKEGLVLHQC